MEIQIGLVFKMLKNENAASFMKNEQVNNLHSSELVLDVPILIGNQIYRSLPFDELHPLAINRIMPVIDLARSESHVPCNLVETLCCINLHKCSG